MATPIDRFRSNEFAMCSTPVKDGTMDGVLRYMDQSGQRRDDSLELEPEPPLNWAKRDPWIDKYIDDANVGQHHHVGQAPGLISVNKEKSCLRATDCEEVFQIIKRNAARVGMRVTDAKTQLVCISTNSALDVHSFANVGGLQITSQLSLKILGFMIGGDLGMGDHVGLISRKFYA